MTKEIISPDEVGIANLKDDLYLDTLSDKDIANLSKGRIVRYGKDFNIKKGPKSKLDSVIPEPGGVYDGRIFGSMYEKKCNCGKVKVMNLPCEVCGTMALDPMDRVTRYAMMETVFYYTSPIKIKSLMNLIKTEFNLEITLVNKDKNPLESLIFSSSEYRFFYILYFLQFNYDPKTNKLVATDELTDKSKISIEGIVEIFKQYKQSKLEELEKYINKLVPIYPASLRKVKITVIAGKKKTHIPKSSIYYRSMIIARDVCLANLKTSSDLYESTALIANFRLYCSTIMMKLSGFYKSSKLTYMRASSYQMRVNKSGRAVIVGDPKLRLDQVGVPRFMAYEMMKKDFVIYMRDVMKIPTGEIAEKYNNPDESIKDAFSRYAETRVVLFNRPPSLMRTSMQAFHVVLTEDEVLHQAISDSTSFNADYDGDACTVFLVPEIYSDYMMGKASPLVNKNYVYNNAPIYKPKHEVLQGWSFISKFIPEEGELIQVIGFDNLQAMFDADEIWVNTTVQMTDKITTYGREFVSNLLECDLSTLIGEDYIKASNISKIFNVLNSFEGKKRMEVIHKLESFALEALTLEGSTTLSVKDLYYEVPEEYKTRIKEIIDSNMSENLKILEAEKVYSSILNDMSSNYSDEFKESISDTDRAKMQSIIAMITPQFFIDSHGVIHFSSNSMVEGYSEEDEKYHAASNREIIKAKAVLVPISGFLERQLSELGKKIIAKDELDPENTGITLEMRKAVGRTTLDGKIVQPNNYADHIVVRSILGTKKTYATPDMFSKTIDFNFDDKVSNIGTDWFTQLGQGITQSGLGLKHGGVNRYVDDYDKLICPFNTDVIILEDRIHLVKEDIYYIKPKRFVTKGDGYYRKGEVIGQVPNYYTASYRLEAIVRFLAAQGSIKDVDLNNDIEIKDCYTGSKSAKVSLSKDGKYYTIGNSKLARNSAMIQYPIGSEIPPFTRYCSGVQNMRNFDGSKLNTRIRIFKSCLSDLVKVTDDIAELLFYALTNKGGGYAGLLKSNTTNNDSALSAISYGYAKKNLTRIVKGELNIDPNDPFTEMNISPLLFSLIKNIEI